MFVHRSCPRVDRTVLLLGKGWSCHNALIQVVFKQSGDISESSKVKVGSTVFINLILSQMPVRCIVRKCSFSRSERLKLFIVFCNQR